MSTKPDPEMTALRRIDSALSELDLPAQERVFSFIASRLHEKAAARRKEDLEKALARDAELAQAVGKCAAPQTA